MLGVAWVAIQPLVTVLIFTLVFGGLADLPSEGLSYAVFVLGGLVLWNYVSASVPAATHCLVDGRELITKIYFPRLLAPIAVTLAPLIDLALGFVVLGVLIAVYGVAPAAGIILMPVWIVAAMIIALAAGSLFAALNVRYRDVGNAIGFVVQLWLFLSPVVFPSSSVHGVARTLLALNPMTGLIDAARWSLFGTSPPPPVDLLSVVSGLLLLIVGVLYFQRVERSFANVV